MTRPSAVYSNVSIALHWVIALLLIGQVALIMISDGLPREDRGFWMMLHKSGGLLILVLTLARIGWRFKEPWLPLPAAMPRWQKVLARGSHIGFYVMLLFMPLTGWAASSAAGRDIVFYGLFNWPLLPIDGGRDAARALMEVHSLGIKVIYVLIALHLAGVIKHLVLDRDNEVRKMLPILPDKGFADKRGPRGAP